MITHWRSAKDASSDRSIEGSETATMFEPNTMRDETSDIVSRTRHLRDASAPRSSIALVIQRAFLIVLVAVTSRERRWLRHGSHLSERRGELAAGRPFLTKRCQAWRVSPPVASA